MDYIESNNIKYNEVAAWLKSKGFEKESNKATAMYNKLKEGKNIMRRSVTIPKDFIGAFVGHLPFELTHPDEDRHLTIRECLTIMGLPKDFILQGGVKNLNHICQNVPVTTATDMADNVLKYVKGYLDNQLIDTDFLVQDNKSQENIYEKKPLQLDRFMV